MSGPGELGRVLETISPAECWSLLRTRSIGRVAVERSGHGPLVVPVSYAVTAQETVVFRTAPGTKVDALLTERASFQVDHIDPVHRTGWSVLIDGRAEVSWGDDGLRIERWSPTPLPFLVTLTAERITGRALRLELLETDQRGYR